MRIAYSLVSPSRRIYLICDRLHLRLVRKCPNSSPNDATAVANISAPKAPGRLTVRALLPKVGSCLSLRSSLCIERVPPFGFLRLPERAKASITRVRRLTQVEIPNLCSDPNRLTAVLRAASSRLTLEHSVFPHTFGIQGLTAPKFGMRSAFP
jgi:hypothetical protein